MFFDPSNPELEKLPYTKELVREFLFKVVDGLRWGTVSVWLMRGVLV